MIKPTINCKYERESILSLHSKNRGITFRLRRLEGGRDITWYINITDDVIVVRQLILYYTNFEMALWHNHKERKVNGKLYLTIPLFSSNTNSNTIRLTL